jgi:hypothetical protein
VIKKWEARTERSEVHAERYKRAMAIVLSDILGKLD